jgi:hypothetical protein
MKSKFILFLCFYLASAVLALGLVLPSYVSTTKTTVSLQKLMSYEMTQAGKNQAAAEGETGADQAVEYKVIADQFLSAHATATLYGHILYDYAVASTAYWIVVVGLLFASKQKQDAK